MIPMGQQNDEWVAAVASYVRTSFGNTGGMVTPADVRRVRAGLTNRTTSFTVPELVATLPAALTPDASTWKLTASHNPAAAASALNLSGWNTQTPQAAGMWFQVELPQAATLTEIQFVSTGGGGRGGGGGGRGAAPAAAPGAGAAAAAGGAPPVAGVAPPNAGGAAGRGAGGFGGGAGVPPVVGYPRGYKVETSMNGTAWTEAASGQATGANVTIPFAPVQARFVRLTQTATTENAPVWSITQLRLFENKTTTR
jgi:hypothetical protein